MNKREIVIRISQRTGVSEEVCKTVLDSFEELFTEELNGTRWKGGLFDKVFQVMNYIKNRKGTV